MKDLIFNGAVGISDQVTIQETSMKRRELALTRFNMNVFSVSAEQFSFFVIYQAKMLNVLKCGKCEGQFCFIVN